MTKGILSSREELKELLNYTQLKRTQSTEMMEEVVRVEEKINKRISSIIMQEEMLVGTSWIIEVHNDGTIHLVNLKEDGNAKVVAIDELISPLYHATYKLRDGISLWDNSYSLTLEFEDIGLIPSFVKELELQVDITSIAKRLRLLKREIRNLETLSHLFNI